MLKDSPIGTPAFYLYNVLYLTFFTGLMTFGMLFIYYLTYEAPNPLKDVENMLGNEASKYIITQENLQKSTVEGKETLHNIDELFGNSHEILRFFVIDKVSSEPVMTVFSIASGGFGGPVKALVGTDGKTITAISATDVSTETAGLGQRIAERAFTRQFIGKTIEQLPRDRTQWTPNGLDIISGATFSSASIANNAIKVFDLYTIGGGN